MSTEGPLSRLMSLLGMADKLKPIPEVKRIEERPVEFKPAPCVGNDPLCPCQDGDACHYRDTPNSPAMPFKMAPTPNDMSESGIHRLYGDTLRRTPNARRFDLKFDYASYRPEHARWICVDENTYDGAPDSEAPSNFIGHGASEKEARMDLLNQFADFDERPRPKAPPVRVMNHTPFDPPDVVDEPYRDPDEE